MIKARSPVVTAEEQTFQNMSFVSCPTHHLVLLSAVTQQYFEGVIYHPPIGEQGSCRQVLNAGK